MATNRIQKAAVIGAGVMGRGIAAHLANARIPVILLDIVPPNPGPEDDVNDPAFRNKFAAGAVEQMKKEKPSPIFTTRDLELITPGNVEDHLELLGDVDWIVEVVPENMDIKRATFDKIEAHARPDAIIASNTSGLSIAGMLEGRSKEFRERFLVTHFFNPVRYMNLLEIVEGADTDPAVTKTVVDFGRDVLGKGIVFGKDTTNFVANRIGTHAMMTVMQKMGDYGMGVADVDAIFGKPMARPKSAVFSTADLVGLDTLLHVAKNCYDTLVDDEEREVFSLPEFVHTMVDNGWTGRKAGGGFYKKTKEGLQELDVETMEYKPRVKPEFDSLEGAKGKPGDRVKHVLHNGEDDAAKFAREVSLRSLAYSARRLGEIADDVVNIDRALRWGFNWDLGPFQTWDALGFDWALNAMAEHDISVPQWVHDMKSDEVGSFYRWDGATEQFYDPLAKEWKNVPTDEKSFSFDVLKKGNSPIKKNDGATLWDIGDGVALLEFHTKMNSVDTDIIEMMNTAVDEVEANYEGLVIGNGSSNFSAGANLFYVLVAAQNEQWDDIEQMIKAFQDANQRMRYSSKPVVAAPTGLTLGGGAEIAMGANAIQAAGELYMGLVEVGVGLIPGGGGNLQLMRNIFGLHSEHKDHDPMTFLQTVFLTIGMGAVAESAEQAREKGFLTSADGVTLNREHIVEAAKQRVLGMSRLGFRAPRPMRFRLPGANGIATVDAMLYSMQHNNQVSAYDRHIGLKLANVICGGETTPAVFTTEQQLLDLEREAFLSLVGEEKTQERMSYMLMNNKPLRN